VTADSWLNGARPARARAGVRGRSYRPLAAKGAGSKRSLISKGFGRGRSSVLGFEYEHLGGDVGVVSMPLMKERTRRPVICWTWVVNRNSSALEGHAGVAQALLFVHRVHVAFRGVKVCSSRQISVSGPA
jgi:hypothetical protein